MRCRPIARDSRVRRTPGTRHSGCTRVHSCTAVLNRRAPVHSSAILSPSGHDHNHRIWIILPDPINRITISINGTLIDDMSEVPL
jgi:hypothetical protein